MEDGIYYHAEKGVVFCMNMDRSLVQYYLDSGKPLLNESYLRIGQNIPHVCCIELLLQRRELGKMVLIRKLRPLPPKTGATGTGKPHPP